MFVRFRIHKNMATTFTFDLSMFDFQNVDNAEFFKKNVAKEMKNGLFCFCSKDSRFLERLK